MTTRSAASTSVCIRSTKSASRQASSRMRRSSGLSAHSDRTPAQSRRPGPPLANPRGARGGFRLATVSRYSFTSGPYAENVLRIGRRNGRASVRKAVRFRNKWPLPIFIAPSVLSLVHGTWYTGPEGCLWHPSRRASSVSCGQPEWSGLRRGDRRAPLRAPARVAAAIPIRSRAAYSTLAAVATGAGHESRKAVSLGIRAPGKARRGFGGSCVHLGP